VDECKPLMVGASDGCVFIARVRTVTDGLVHETSIAPPLALSAKPLAMVPLVGRCRLTLSNPH
jgi:hypothetical protein